MSAGWGRTNRWWRPGLGGARGALGGQTWRSDEVQAWWSGEPRVAHAPDADGWAQVGDVRARLLGVEAVDGLDDGYGGRIEAPAGYPLWAAEVSLRAGAAPGPRRGASRRGPRLGPRRPHESGTGAHPSP